tara:strand:+ start:21841 stop:22149 length:309 start_codon:yes stop_codon:yes gene_type:complete
MILYNDIKFGVKTKKLSRLYDMTKPRDVFTVVMQEMEVAEVLAMSKEMKKNKGAIKKHTVVTLLQEVCKSQEVEIDFEWITSYIDDMSVATKCKYAINKEQP